MPSENSFLVQIKGVFMGLVLVVTYAAMIIDIIGVLKVRQGESERSPAVIAALTAAILQAIWCAYYIISGAKGAVFKASSVLAAMMVFFVWQIIAIPIAYVYNHRSDVGYCAPDNVLKSDCDGAFKGVVGLGFCVAFLDLIYAGYLAALVSTTRAAWSDELHNIPAREPVVEVKGAKA